LQTNMWVNEPGSSARAKVAAPPMRNVCLNGSHRK